MRRYSNNEWHLLYQELPNKVTWEVGVFAPAQSCCVWGSLSRGWVYSAEKEVPAAVVYVLYGCTHTQHSAMDLSILRVAWWVWPWAAHCPNSSWTTLFFSFVVFLYVTQRKELGMLSSGVNSVSALVLHHALCDTIYSWVAEGWVHRRQGAFSCQTIEVLVHLRALSVRAFHELIKHLSFAVFVNTSQRGERGDWWYVFAPWRWTELTNVRAHTTCAVLQDWPFPSGFPERAEGG